MSEDFVKWAMTGKDDAEVTEKGGSGSGNFGHKGIPGVKGGSLPGSGKGGASGGVGGLAKKVGSAYVGGVKKNIGLAKKVGNAYVGGVKKNIGIAKSVAGGIRDAGHVGAAVSGAHRAFVNEPNKGPLGIRRFGRNVQSAFSGSKHAERTQAAHDRAIQSGEDYITKRGLTGTSAERVRAGVRAEAEAKKRAFGGKLGRASAAVNAIGGGARVGGFKEYEEYLTIEEALKEYTPEQLAEGFSSGEFELVETEKGGGNFGHKGRPGQRGGSTSKGGGVPKKAQSPSDKIARGSRIGRLAGMTLGGLVGGPLGAIAGRGLGGLAGGTIAYRRELKKGNISDNGRVSGSRVVFPVRKKELDQELYLYDFDETVKGFGAEAVAQAIQEGELVYVTPEEVAEITQK